MRRSPGLIERVGKMSYTKGKWKLWPHRENKNPIICVGDTAETLNGIAEIYGIGTEAEANARLIVAAPETKEQRDELLEALKDMVIQYGGMIDSDVEEEARAAVLNARAIIAKCEKG